MNRIEDFPRPPLVLPGMDEVQESEEGTVVKLFFHRGEWVTSTNKKINAKRSHWSSPRSFHELFLDALPNNNWTDATDTLKTEMVYSFVLLHPENYMVIFHPHPTIVHVATRSLKSSEEVHEEVLWAHKPNMTVSLETSNSGRGVIVIDRSDKVDVRRRKLDRPEYQVAQDLRKNMKHMHLSYLACKGDERAAFLEMFPSFVPCSVGIDHWLSLLVDEIHRAYMKSFVRKQYLFEKDHPYFPVVMGCHKLYKTTGNKVTKSVCQSVINTLPAPEIDAALAFCSQKHVQAQKKM